MTVEKFTSIQVANMYILIGHFVHPVYSGGDGVKGLKMIL